MEYLKDLSQVLWETQKEIVGVFKNPYSKAFELVVESNDVTFTTIYIGSMLGLSTTTYSYGQYSCTLFEDTTENHNTLADIMQQPYEFRDWCEKYMK